MNYSTFCLNCHKVELSLYRSKVCTECYETLRNEMDPSTYYYPLADVGNAGDYHNYKMEDLMIEINNIMILKQNTEMFKLLFHLTNRDMATVIMTYAKTNIRKTNERLEDSLYDAPLMEYNFADEYLSDNNDDEIQVAEEESSDESIYEEEDDESSDEDDI